MKQVYSVMNAERGPPCRTRKRVVKGGGGGGLEPVSRKKKRAFENSGKKK